MSTIKVTNLVDNSIDSDSFVRDLSTCELSLQGGRSRRTTPVLPAPEISNWPTPVDPSFDFLPPFANFYI
jgi:hypothetical protein